MPCPRLAGASRASSASDAGAGGAAIDADLDGAIEAVIAANSQYQVGVALMDTVGGQLHQYGVRESFQAASTAKVLDQEHTEQLLSSMHGTNFEDLIPAAVPAAVSVFHKYGLLDDELHDAAILSTSAGSYVLVVYTKGTGLGDVPQRTAVVHDIT
jgi:beta-lactamase class A